MPVAHAIDPTSGLPSWTASAERSHTASWAVVLAAVAALTLAILGWGYLAAGAGDGFPDPTQQWTD